MSKRGITISTILGVGGTVLALLFLDGDARAVASLLLIGMVALAAIRRGWSGGAR